MCFVLPFIIFLLKASVSRMCGILGFLGGMIELCPPYPLRGICQSSQPVPVNVTLFGNQAFVDIIKDLEVRSS